MTSKTLSSIVGGGLKGVQRGSVISSGTGTTNITITAVNIEKSFLTINYGRDQDGSSGHPGTPGAALTTSTNIAVIGDLATPCVVYWEVVEYD
jgi:hypothetical protein